MSQPAKTATPPPRAPMQGRCGKCGACFTLDAPSDGAARGKAKKYPKRLVVDVGGCIKCSKCQSAFHFKCLAHPPTRLPFICPACTFPTAMAGLLTIEQTAGETETLSNTEDTDDEDWHGEGVTKFEDDEEYIPEEEEMSDEEGRGRGPTASAEAVEAKQLAKAHRGKEIPRTQGKVSPPVMREAAVVTPHDTVNAARTTSLMATVTPARDDDTRKQPTVAPKRKDVEDASTSKQTAPKHHKPAARVSVVVQTAAALIDPPVARPRAKLTQQTEPWTDADTLLLAQAVVALDTPSPDQVKQVFNALATQHGLPHRSATVLAEKAQLKGFQLAVTAQAPVTQATKETPLKKGPGSRPRWLPEEDELIKSYIDCPKHEAETQYKDFQSKVKATLDFTPHRDFGQFKRRLYKLRLQYGDEQAGNQN